MLRFTVVTALAVLLAVGAVPAQDADPAMSTTWNGGLTIQNADGSVKLNIGGQVHNDWVKFVSQDDDLTANLGDFADGTELRSVRLDVRGTLYGNTDFRIQYDFANGSAAPKFVYMGFRGLPIVGSLRAGHLKEPVGLDWLTSSNAVPFMERSFANALVPGWNTGILACNAVLNRRMTWSLGTFRDSGSTGSGTGDKHYAFSGRVTGLLWGGGAGSVGHLGLGASYRHNVRPTAWKVNAGSHLSPSVAWLSVTGGQDTYVLAPELLVIHGPISLQAEGTALYIDEASNPLYGAYAMLSYVVTGGSRSYSTTSAAPGNVRPRSNFGQGGAGAWEVLARYSYVDIEGSTGTEANVSAIDLGLTWYANPNTKIMWNIGLTDITTAGHSGSASFAQMRCQVNL